MLSIVSCADTKTAIVKPDGHYKGITVKNDCDCAIDKEIENKGRYRPPISLLLDYTEFKKASDWKPENGYAKVSFTKMRNGGSMSLVSKEPIRITHKNNALTLNLTPCSYKDRFYKIPYFGIDLKRQDSRDLNENFDYTAFAYFDYLISGTNRRAGKSPKALLRKILEEDPFYLDSSNDRVQFIRSTNTEYNLNLKEQEILKDDGLQIIDLFIAALENSNIEIPDFIVKEFVLTDNTDHRINEEEQRKLKRMFSIHNELFFKQIDFKLKNQLYNGYISEESGTLRIGVEISKNIIRKLNPITHRPELDSIRNDVASDIMLYTDGFHFSNYEQDKVTVDSICASTSEITDTGILLGFDKAKLILPQKEVMFDYQTPSLDVKNYPLFKKVDHKDESKEYTSSEACEPTLLNFTGLTIPYANVQIPFNEKRLAVKGKNLIVNNFFISGAFEIKMDSENESDDELLLSTGNVPIGISMNGLLHHFKKIGLGEVELVRKGDILTVYFLKEADE